MPKITLTLLLATVSTSLLAQPGNEALVDVSACVTIAAASERHACFDRITAHLQNQEVAVSAESAAETGSAEQARGLPRIRLPRLFSRNEVNADEVGTAAVTEPGEAESTAQVEDFGKTTSARVAQDDSGSLVLQDRIAALREREPGQMLITLESGQLWYQTITKSGYRLRKGMEVEISLSTFGGSYHLSTPSLNGFIQVVRIE